MRFGIRTSPQESTYDGVRAAKDVLHRQCGHRTRRFLFHLLHQR